MVGSCEDWTGKVRAEVISNVDETESAGVTPKVCCCRVEGSAGSMADVSSSGITKSTCVTSSNCCAGDDRGEWDWMGGVDSGSRDLYSGGVALGERCCIAGESNGDAWSTVSSRGTETESTLVIPSGCRGSDDDDEWAGNFNASCSARRMNKSSDRGVGYVHRNLGTSVLEGVREGIKDIEGSEHKNGECLGLGLR